MKERPILFSAPMVRAILAGTKTQTRRIVKSEHVEDADIWAYSAERDLWESGLGTDAPGRFGHGEWVRCPYGKPGDKLWVRETFCHRDPEYHPERGYWYAATDDVDDPRWTPSIHMPRRASRITLNVTNVRVERLQDISEEDAKAEGVRPFLETHDRFSPEQRIDGDSVTEKPHRTAFVCLWDEINGDRALFASNPWVWVVEFKQATNAAAEDAFWREQGGDS